MNPKVECTCGTLLAATEVDERSVSDRVTCQNCGSTYVLTATRLVDGRRETGRVAAEKTKERTE